MTPDAEAAKAFVELFGPLAVLALVAVCTGLGMLVGSMVAAWHGEPSWGAWRRSTASPGRRHRLARPRRAAHV